MKRDGVKKITLKRVEKGNVDGKRKAKTTIPIPPKTTQTPKIFHKKQKTTTNKNKPSQPKKTHKKQTTTTKNNNQKNHQAKNKTKQLKQYKG